MKIKKQWVSWEEFDKIQGGNWTPSAHSHKWVDITDPPDFIRADEDDNVSAHTEWQDTYEARFGNAADFRIWHDGSNHYMRGYKHGANILLQAEDEGGVNRTCLTIDPDFYGIITTKVKLGAYYLSSLVANNKVSDSDKWGGNAFADYMNQAVKSTSNPQFAGVKLGGDTYYLGNGAAVSKLYRMYIDEIYADLGGVTDPSYTFDGDKNTGMYSSGADVLDFTCGGTLRLKLNTARVEAYLDFKTPKLTIGSYYLNSLIANNKVPDSDKLDGSHGTAFMKKSGGTFTGNVFAKDHGSAATDMIVNVCFGTGGPPAAGGTTIGALYLKYTN